MPLPRRRLLTTALGAAAAVPLGAVPLAASSAAASPAAAPGPASGAAGWRRVPHRGIRPDDPDGRAPLANPRRGFRYEMSYNAADLTSPWENEHDHSPDAARTLDLLERRYGRGADLTQLYFYLWEYATSPLPPSALDNIESGLRGLRGKGYAAVLRFAYDDGVRAQRRYTVQDIQRHIGQLAPLIARHSDTVAVWQAGFLGDRGEWHGSYCAHETYPDAVTALMTTLVGALPPGLHTQLRQAAHRDLVTDPALLDRIGFHNDYVTLGEGEWDYYVPANPGWPTYLDVTRGRMTDGEMPWDKGQSTDPYAWSTVIPALAAARRLQTLRFDSLSLVHNATVTLPAWKTTDLTEAQLTDARLPVSDGYFRDRAGRAVPRTAFEYLRDHLGYRIEVREARYAPSGIRRDGRLPVEVDVVNHGFAPPKHPRPARLVLLDAAGRTVAAADTRSDWRTWHPRGRAETDDDHGAPATATLRARLPVPAGARGPYRLGLALPDPDFPDRGLPVRCANASTPWTNGVNVLADVEPSG